MPRIRRRGVPKRLLEHLWLRVDERKISIPQLELFATWLETGPEVPHGKWFKRFPEMTVCGEGELIPACRLPPGSKLEACATLTARHGRADSSPTVAESV